MSDAKQKAEDVADDAADAAAEFKPENVFPGVGDKHVLRAIDDIISVPVLGAALAAQPFTYALGKLASQLIVGPYTFVVVAVVWEVAVLLTIGYWAAFAKRRRSA